jgi:tetratricopeptide (TPR) repeat protein
LWYHLSGGRYFWQNGTIAGDAFFSYIVPPKSWYDYYWLFQVIVFKLYQWTGYEGLVGLRCLLYVLTTLFISLFFLDRSAGPTKQVIGLFFFICYPIALIFRELLVRPHLFSYFFIVVFLYILELKRDKIWLLPILGIFWCNIHGIEYPVMIMIVFAYLAELYYHDFKKEDQHQTRSKSTKWLLILTLYTVFVTPHVVELIKTPFNISYGNALYQQLYVSELIPIDFKHVFTFSVYPFSHLNVTLQHFLLLASPAFFLLCLWKRSMRLSHLIIFSSSLLLLIKHNRFIYEFILLSIPLVRHGLAQIGNPSDKKSGLFLRIAPLLLIIILIVIPWLTYASQFRNRPAYPFTQFNLPTGVTTFLNSINAGGNIMNEPNTGGYIQWALDGRYKIFMDMQLAIFTDRDFAFVNSAFNDAGTFRMFVRKYNPSFLSVSLERSQFRDLIEKFPEFKPVFCDDKEVLYVNAKHYPQIAAAYEIKQIDPFQASHLQYEKETPDRLSRIFAEAMRMRNIYPEGVVTNTIIANILIINKEYEKALPYGELVIARYPDFGAGYAIKADALLGLGRFQEAAAFYRAAIATERISTVTARSVYRNLHVCYVRLKDYKKAYQALVKNVNPFNLSSDYKDIYELGLAAAAAGNLRDGVNFLKIAEMKLPPDDAVYSRKIKENLRMLDPEGKMEKTQ